MKEFILTQPYLTLDEMVNSAEVAIYKEELQQGDIDKYAIVSRIGNRYDVNGNKIDDFADNPFIAVNEEKATEVKSMKYCEIEMLIDKEIEKAVEQENAKHAQEIEALKQEHSQALANAKAEAKAELIAKLNA